jgi:hypothetical protein
MAYGSVKPSIRAVGHGGAFIACLIALSHVFTLDEKTFSTP